MSRKKKPRPEMTPELRSWCEQTVIDLMPRIVKTVYKNKLSAAIPAEDLIQEAAKAAFECLPRFDASRGLKPWTFVYPRVIGAMKDYARAAGFVLQGGQRTGRKEHIASLDAVLTYENYDERPTSLRDVVVDQLAEDPSVTPDANWEQLLKGFSPRDRLAITSYFRRGMTYKQIGALLGVSESCVSQKMKFFIYDLRELERSENRVTGALT